MKLVKISPKYQITIPKTHHNLCSTGWFSINLKEGLLVLRPIELKEQKSEKEIIEELCGQKIDDEYWRKKLH